MQNNGSALLKYVNKQRSVAGMTNNNYTQEFKKKAINLSLKSPLITSTTKSLDDPKNNTAYSC